MLAIVEFQMDGAAKFLANFSHFWIAHKRILPTIGRADGITFYTHFYSRILWISITIRV